MKPKNYKKLIPTAIIAITLGLLSFNAVSAANITGLLKTAGGAEGAGFETATEFTISERLGSMVQYLLSFLGVIFIILTVYGGFLWMTAAGDEEQVTKAKDIIKSSVIGLIIVLSAMTITAFVLGLVGLSWQEPPLSLNSSWLLAINL